MVAGTDGVSTLQLLFGKPDATLQPPWPLALGLAPSGLVALDVNGDRSADLLALGAEGYSFLLADGQLEHP